MLPPTLTPAAAGDDHAAQTPAILSRKEMAVYLRRGLSTLDRDAAQGLIPAPCFRIQRSPRWRKATIDRWLDAGAPPAEEWAKLQAAEARQAPRRRA